MTSRAGVAALLLVSIAAVLVLTLERRAHVATRQPPSPGTAQNAATPAVEAPPASPSPHRDSPPPPSTNVARGPLDPVALPDHAWNEFYGKLKSQRLPHSEYCRLILERVAEELSLSGADREYLAALLAEEDAHASRQVIERYGGWDEIRHQLKQPYEVRRPALDGIHHQRETIRRTYDARYLQRLTPEQLAMLNEHLRNHQIILADENGRHSVAGVGR